MAALIGAAIMIVALFGLERLIQWAERDDWTKLPPGWTGKSE